MTGDWERLESETVGDYEVFDVIRHVMRSPRTGRTHAFHVVDVPLCAQVVALTEDGRVILVEQFRQGVQRMSLEFPAGVLEGGEDPVEGAVRELEEETGYRPRHAELLGDFDPDPAIQSNRIHVVLARGCTPDGERDQDDGEDVSVRLASVDEVRELIRRGRIRHAAAISAWYFYEAVASRRGLG
ncbi:MAG TPA: NUDIX hydrolase [Longimicrobiales bacterium]|nr:NUDIX hydrolase [Longimicrobiales bacterium]